MKKLPDNWFLLRIHKDDFVFSNKQGSYYVHIDFMLGSENHYSIYYLQKQTDFMVIGLEKMAVFSTSTTWLSALEKAYTLMDSIDEFFMKDA